MVLQTAAAKWRWAPAPELLVVNDPNVPALIGESPTIETLHTLLAKLANTRRQCAIHGESGTGKELAARILHASGAARQRPLCRRQLRCNPRRT